MGRALGSQRRLQTGIRFAITRLARFQSFESQSHCLTRLQEQTFGSAVLWITIASVPVRLQ
jgi:hypothetical protein